jgi:flagellar assembly protein FliH
VPAAEFVALADLLRAPAFSAPSEAKVVEERVCEEEEPTVSGSPELHAAARDARLFRARLADAFDDASARLLRELAVAVLARELTLAPCDLAALARDVLLRAPCVRLRVAPEDAGGDYGMPTIADPTLGRGDAIFELAGGALDARFGVRLAAVFEELG